MPEIIIHESLRNIRRDQWDACFANMVEGYDYLCAIEAAGIAGFNWAYATAWEGEVMLSAMPAFLTDYALDTTLQGMGKQITGAIASAFPNLLKLKLACLGSPCTETGAVGFHPSVTDADKISLLQVMLDKFEHFAALRKCKLIGIKDIPQDHESMWALPVGAYKYATMPGLPTAYLDIDFASMDEYLARLSAGTRKDMRRKLKAADSVRHFNTHTLDGILPEIMALYHDTRNRSDWQFEELTESYFTGVLERMPDRSFCTLYYAGDNLLAANLLIHDEHTLIDKFFCMNGDSGRAYNLYFLSWFTNIAYCLEHGIKRYQSGQAYYENKLRLGSKLTSNSMYFKHRNALAQGLLKLATPFLAADEHSQEAA